MKKILIKKILINILGYPVTIPGMIIYKVSDYTEIIADIYSDNIVDKYHDFLMKLFRVDRADINNKEDIE